MSGPHGGDLVAVCLLKGSALQLSSRARVRVTLASRDARPRRRSQDSVLIGGGDLCRRMVWW